VVPDWVCEILSRSNARYDRSIKLPFYARVGVLWAWLVDERDQTIEVRELVAGAWVERQVVSQEPRVRLQPFESIQIPLARLWLRESSP
jgi:Uma2 family endonuclease